jgi:hypothetical protein
MPRHSKITINIVLLVFVLSFVLSSYHSYLGRSISFVEILAVIVSLFLLFLSLLQLYIELASKQRALEQRMHSLEMRLSNIPNTTS